MNKHAALLDILVNSNKTYIFLIKHIFLKEFQINFIKIYPRNKKMCNVHNNELFIKIILLYK